MRIAQSPRITPYGPGDPETWGCLNPYDFDAAADLEDQIEAEAARIWAAEIHTPFSAAEISEALGEMTEAQHLEMAEAQADEDDRVLGRFLKRTVNSYWETWARNKAMEKLKNEY